MICIISRAIHKTIRSRITPSLIFMPVCALITQRKGEKMAEELRLKAKHREVLGKKTRFLRRQGITPAHLYGHGVKSVALQCETEALEDMLAQAGTTRMLRLTVDGKQARSVFIREVQKDPLGKELLHVDFYQVRLTEKMAVEVPIVLVGEAPALKTKGRMLQHGLTNLHIEALPDKIPPQIEVDIGGLEDTEHAILVQDLALDKDITVHHEPEQLIVKVSEVRVREEVEEVPEAEEEEVAEEEAEARAEAGEAAPAEQAEKAGEES
jgi:large subunit ribosomal protein L25